MKLITFIIFLFLHAISCQRQKPPLLSPMNLNANHITLSGFSSGGTFAQQFQLSYSNLFDGIAVFSDTYYRCGSATGRIEDYESTCTKLNSNQRSRRDFNVSNAISELERNALTGLIEDPKNLLNTRLFVFAGTRNSKFTADQSLRILDIYEPFIQNLSNIYVEIQIAENVLPSNSFGENCHGDASRNFYIANCNFAGAYESLRFLLRNLLSFPERNIPVHSLDEFDQSEFFNGTDGNYMDKVGFMYIPSRCRDSSIKCLLHFYFHGCSTGREFNGTSHIVNSGFLQVAEANDIVMIFPQTLSSDDNEEGCWDTFGLTGNLFATKSGRQVEIMRKMLERLIPSLTRTNPSGGYGGYSSGGYEGYNSGGYGVPPPLPQPINPINLILPNGTKTVLPPGAQAFEILDKLLMPVPTPTIPQPKEEPKYTYTAYQPSVLCTPQAPPTEPKTSEEVKNLIKDVIRRNLTLKAMSHLRGTRTDLICSQGLAFETRNFKRMQISSDAKTVLVGTGVKVKELFEYLHKKGYTLETATTFGGLTIGGALGVAAHGTSLNHAGCVSDLLVGITVIDGEGNTRKVKDPEDLKAFKCHLGLLGFIVDARLKIVPDFKIAIQNTLYPESFLLDGSALMAAKTNDFFQMFWFPSTKQVVASEGTHVPLYTPGSVRNTLIGKMSRNTTLDLKCKYEKAQAFANVGLLKRLNEYGKRSLYQKVNGREPMLTEDGETLKNPGVGYAKDILTSECGQNCRWNYNNDSLLDSWDEIGIDIGRLDAAVHKLKRIFNHYKAIFPLLGVFIRFAKKSDGLMAMSSGQDTAFLEISTPMRFDRFQNARAYLEAIQSFVQCLVNDFDGRPHWAKNGLHYHSTRMIEKYAGLERFKRAMKKFDPNGTFLNFFGMRLLGKSNLTNVDPKVEHCALEQNCECTKNSDCSLDRECSTNSFGYKVCSPIYGVELKPKVFKIPQCPPEIPEKVPKNPQSQRKIPKIVPNFPKFTIY